MIRNKAISQIQLFKTWLEENIDKFICKPKIFNRKSKDHLSLRYEGIINNIVIQVDDHSSIDVRVEALVGLECVDLLADFLVDLKTTDEGKYYNFSILEQYRQYYNDLQAVFYDEFNNFLEWSNALISEKNFLYVYNCYDSLSLAKVLKPEQLDKYKEDESNEFIAKIIALKKIM